MTRALGGTSPVQGERICLIIFRNLDKIRFFERDTSGHVVLDVSSSLPGTEREMRNRQRSLLPLAFGTTLLLLAGDAGAQAPPHSPALWYAGDFWSSFPTGILIPEFFVWPDEISGVPASLYGVGNVEVHNGELNGHSFVRDNTGYAAGPGSAPPGHAHWRIHDVDMPAGLLTGTNDYTIMAVVRPSVPIPNVDNVGVAALWGPASHQWYLSAEPGSGFQRTFHSFGGTNGGTFQSLSSVGLTTPDLTQDFHTFGWVKSGGATPIIQYHSNGISTAVNGSTIGNLGPNDEMHYGRRFQFMNANGQFNGDFAELIVYDKALDAQQLADLDSYLGSKFFAAGLPGDFNGNGILDPGDFTTWRDHLGASEDGSVLNGNGNSGTVDQSDYELWKTNYGNVGVASGAASAAVPEPSAVALALLAVCALVARRRDRGSRIGT